MLKAFYHIINFYTRHFPFPHRGWKYLRFVLRRWGLDDKFYKKKIQKGVYLRVNAVDHIQQQLFWYGYYEKEAIRLWQALIDKDAVVLDIGANIGYYTLMAAQKATAGRIYAFEPSPGTYRQLQQNIAVNGNLSAMEALPYAIGDHEGTAAFFISGPDNTGMSGFAAAENFSGQTVMVPVVALDSWARAMQLKKIDLIKIDIEGAEIKALAGMPFILRHHQPVLFMEIRKLHLQQYGESPESVYRLLFSHGYAAYEIVAPLTLRTVRAGTEGDSIIFMPKGHRLPPGTRILPNS